MVNLTILALQLFGGFFCLPVVCNQIRDIGNELPFYIFLRSLFSRPRRQKFAYACCAVLFLLVSDCVPRGVYA